MNTWMSSCIEVCGAMAKHKPRGKFRGPRPPGWDRVLISPAEASLEKRVESSLKPPQTQRLPGAACAFHLLYMWTHSLCPFALPLSAMEDLATRCHLETERAPAPGTELAGASIVDFLTSRTVKREFFLFANHLIERTREGVSPSE